MIYTTELKILVNVARHSSRTRIIVWGASIQASVLHFKFRQDEKSMADIWGKLHAGQSQNMAGYI